MSDYSQLLQNATWQPSTDMQLPLSISSWLELSTSLTTQLKQAFGEVNVCVLAESWITTLNENERQFFPKQACPCWCREVILKSQDIPLIFARTLIPASLLTQHRELQQLGNRALGEWLFMQSDRIRQKLELTQDKNTALYARRALMSIGAENMMVAELFLIPQIFTRVVK
ncbi:TPA: chorismate lyase [Pasteurella multocida]